MWELQYEERSPKRFERFVNSFKPYDVTESLVFSDYLSQVSSVTTVVSRHNADPHSYDLRAAAIESANARVARKLKGRHLQMIAIGGAVGSGLFVASGQALQTGGPASLLIAFSTIGIMLYVTCQALAELAVIFPVVGSFSSYATRFIDPSWGFAMGWM
jgi:amino acid transporter